MGVKVKKNKNFLIFCVALSVLGLMEVGVRFFGLVNFPLYMADDVVGYQVEPNQSGTFMNKNRWVFNEKSMGIDQAFEPNSKRDVLLIGDSIVLGGNPLDQDQKLGARLTRKTGRMHWPISAGSWSLLNELAYIKRNPDVVEHVAELIFVVNSADFDQASSWACELTHPRKYPVLALPYLFEKYILKRTSCGETPSELKVPKSDWRFELQAFAKSAPAKGKVLTFLLYPTKDEAGNHGLLADRLESRGKEISQLLNGHDLRVYSLARDPRWHLVDYTDGIHPSQKGVSIMAEIIGDLHPQ